MDTPILNMSTRDSRKCLFKWTEQHDKENNVEQSVTPLRNRSATDKSAGHQRRGWLRVHQKNVSERGHGLMQSFVLLWNMLLYIKTHSHRKVNGLP